MSADAILASLETGSMKMQGSALTEVERKSVSAYLGRMKEAKGGALPDVCRSSEEGGASHREEVASWTNWGVTYENTRFQTAAGAGLTQAQVADLRLKWAFDLGQNVVPRSQPAVALGRIFVGADEGNLYALDARSGCTYWVFKAEGVVRSGIAVDVERRAVLFGDQRANAYAVDAGTGRLLWKRRVDEHPAALVTAAPAVHGGVVYVAVSSYEEALAASPKYTCCTFRGSVVALNATSGDQIWKTYTTGNTASTARGPSGAAVWSTPTFDEKRDVLYVATGDNYGEPPTPTSDAVLALDTKTGKLLWSKQATSEDIYNIGCDAGVKDNCPRGRGRDFDFGQPPMLVSLSAGKRALIIGQKSGTVYAFDPDQEGKPLWNRKVGEGGALGGIQWGSAAEGDQVFVALSDVGTHAVPDKSAPQGFRMVLDPMRGGGLFALRAATGEVLWSVKPAICGDRKNCSPAQSAAVSAIPGVIFSGSLDGHLRAFDSRTGAKLWDVDTARDYDAVNGGKAHGGSLDVAGPVIAGGSLYVLSGYGVWGGMPGNVLLAYSTGN